MLRERLSHACLYLRNKLNLNALHENLKYYIYLKCPGIQIRYVYRSFKICHFLACYETF
nr:MAG TPA: hypothetical protein [Crassvirales sp.]